MPAVGAIIRPKNRPTPPAPAQSKEKMKIEAKVPQTKEKSGLSFTEKHRLEALPSVIERLEGEIAKLETYLAVPDLMPKNH